MRKAAGITLGLFGLAVLSIPGAALLWAHRQYAIGLSSNSVAMMIGLAAAVGVACLFVGYGMVRRQISS
jgi:hypothetical protein